MGRCNMRLSILTTGKRVQQKVRSVSFYHLALWLCNQSFLLSFVFVLYWNKYEMFQNIPFSSDKIQKYNCCIFNFNIVSLFSEKWSSCILMRWSGLNSSMPPHYHTTKIMAYLDHRSFLNRNILKSMYFSPPFVAADILHVLFSAK